MSSLTVDQRYNEKRVKIQKRHKNKFFQGIYSLGYGLKDGLRGIVTQPVQHFKSQGPRGLLEGTIKGIMGVVFKPITGVVDLGSGIAYSFKDLLKNG